MSERFSIRNVTCDYYLHEVDEFSVDKLGHLTGLLPILRIFGIVKGTGEKCCAHIHGVFPYILIKTLSQPDQPLKDLIKSTLINILSKNLKPQEDPIVELKEMEAKSIYGYVVDDDYFVQIFFKNPFHVKIASLELQRQALSNPNMQPFYSHIPYILQFFVQYDIFGMDLIHFNLDDINFREPPKNLATFSCLNSPMMPSTRMQVEFDVFGESIQNPLLLSNSQFVNKGLKLIYTDELARNAGQELIGLSPEGQREIIGKSKTESDYLQKLKEFCENATQLNDPKIISLMSSQLDAFSQVNNRILNDDGPNRGAQDLGNLRGTDESPIWDDMEMQIRGFDVDYEEDSHENEEIFVDNEDENQEDSVGLVGEFDLQIEESKQIVRKSGVVRPIYPTVSSNFEENLDEGLVHIQPINRKFDPKLAFSETPLTQMHFLDALTPKSSRIRAESSKVSSTSGINNLCALALEIFALPQNKSEEIANPERDPILAVGMAICDNVAGGNIDFCYEKVFMVTDEEVYNPKIMVVQTENELFDEVAKVVNRFDPDVFIGYDLFRGSFGYLCERATHIQHLHFLEKVCRLKNARFLKDIPVSIGRIRLEVWRVVKREAPMRSYAFSSLVANLLKKPFPELQIHDLITLNETDIELRTVAAIHFLEMAKNDILILDTVDVFVGTSQMARVFGIQFCDVLARGSQFRVESMLLRVAKQLKYQPPSISVEQRNRMDSPLTIPLNLEPISGIYRDPVAVLDFQSLYPSVCIAYNYCFSSCLGKVSQILTSNQNIKLGALDYSTLSAVELKRLLNSDQIHISPTGGVFVKRDTRLGVLPRMLKELLDTRLMVKRSMKKYKNNKKFYRMLNAQQLALKLVANVTYGYTAANWSGRMPCDVVADAIVSKGREALENAIHMINNASDNKYKGATVIYGDTDSCFVLFKGCSREEAFELGRQIAADVTASNPYPMKLKFEKIMQPCVLLTKKRYVGNSYENSPDEEPKFDAKGIETVRRDSCLFVSKLMEKCLKILFEKDAGTVIQFLRSQLGQLERFPFSDFILNAGFRDGYSDTVVIPIKKLAQERKQKSDRLSPVHGERLPFLIVQHRKSLNRKRIPLIECVVSWEHFLANTNLQINYNYYIGKNLFSALGRIFDLVPVKLNWHPFISSSSCMGCSKAGVFPFCPKCIKSIAIIQRSLTQKTLLQRQKNRNIRACNECISSENNCNLGFIECSNMSCNIMENRLKVARNAMLTEIKKHRLYMESNEPIYLSQ